MGDSDQVADAISMAFVSPNVRDSNMEAANVVDVLERAASGLHRIASAILPANAAPGTDACGGSIDSLTESVMGVSSGLCRIADAIDNLADAIRESNPT